MKPPKLLYGQLPNWKTSGDAAGNGYGSVYGYGYGDGSVYGSGYGYGYGDGYGDGSGYGYGYGDGYGDGSGYVYGYGDGYGDGSVYGSGYGDGSGYGSGYGDGYGYGIDDGAGYWGQVFAFTVKKWPRLQELLPDSNVSFGYWWSNADGLPANGGTREIPAVPGLVQEIKGPLKLCTNRSLHATLNPEKWVGKRLWLVALFDEIQQRADKLGALKREILGEIII